MLMSIFFGFLCYLLRLAVKNKVRIMQKIKQKIKIEDGNKTN